MKGQDLGWVLIVLVVFLVVGGCGTTSQSLTPSTETGSALVKRSQMLMGTLVFVTAVASEEETAKRAAAAGLAEIRRLETILSTWIPSSELSRVNKAAGREPVPVSPETYELIQESLDIGILTEGGFNIAIGPAVSLWNISGSSTIPKPEDLARIHELIRLPDVQLNQDNHTLFLSKPGMQVDVGGIGKGYAADKAEAVMKKAGATAGVIALSGDIKTFGRMPNGERFVFGIQHPRSDGKLIGRLELENEAVSTAGDYQSYFMKDGIRYHHILDPKTLQPARLCQSVTVVAKKGVQADGLDTGIFVMGPQRGMALVERLPNVEAVIVDKNGQLSVSSGLYSRLKQNF